MTVSHGEGQLGPAGEQRLEVVVVGGSQAGLASAVGRGLRRHPGRGTAGLLVAGSGDRLWVAAAVLVVLIAAGVDFHP